MPALSVWKAAHDRAKSLLIFTVLRIRGTLVRDGFASYQWYGQSRHSLCNAHLLRDLVFVSEVSPEQKVWIEPLAKLLLKIKRKVADTKTQP